VLAKIMKKMTCMIQRMSLLKRALMTSGLWKTKVSVTTVVELEAAKNN
jgi:hypothetical protein